MNHELADDPHDRLVDVLLEEALRSASQRAVAMTPAASSGTTRRARWFAFTAALLGLSAVVTTMLLREEPRSVAPVQQPQDPAPSERAPWVDDKRIVITKDAELRALAPEFRRMRVRMLAPGADGVSRRPIPGAETVVEDADAVRAFVASLPPADDGLWGADGPLPWDTWIAFELADGRHVDAFHRTGTRTLDAFPLRIVDVGEAVVSRVDELVRAAARTLRLSRGIVEQVTELAELPTSVTSLRCPMLDRSDMPALVRLQNLTHLTLLGIAAPDAGMLGAKLPELPMRFAADLAALPKLQHLQLLAAFCDDRAAGELAQLPHLVSLRLDHSVKGVRGGLGMSGPGRITIEGMRTLATKLTALELHGLPQSDAVYELFLSQAQLQRFACFDYELPPALVARFARLPTLRELGLGPCTGEHLAALAGSRLERLELAIVTAAAADFAALPKSLRELDLRRSGLAAAELGEALAKLLPQVAIRWPGTADATELPELAPTKRAPR